MTTFSQLVDELVLETRMANMTREIASYLNQTIREVHFDPQTNAILYFRDNYREEQIIADSESGSSWTVPRPELLQDVSLVRYDSVIIDGEMTYAEEYTTRMGRNRPCYSYMRAGSKVFFSSYGGLNARISLAYFEYPPPLTYMARNQRPCEYDLFGFNYAEEYATTEEAQTQAQLVCTNWLLMRWRTVIEEGLRAKIYKRLSDDARSRTCYSQFQALRRGLMTAELIR